MYTLGVDLGATSCTASVFRSDHASVVRLGASQLSSPSVVALDVDGAIIIGEAAAALLRSNSGRAVAGVHQRVGDDTPVLIGGHALPAEHLIGHQLRSLVDAIAEAQGERPAAVAVGRPVDWGGHRRERFADAVSYSAVPNVEIVDTPTAVLEHYASLGAVDEAEAIGVFDMGGTSVVASIIGSNGNAASGGGSIRVNGLGGAVLDDELFAFVCNAMPAEAEVDLAALLAACISAKLELSANTEATVDVAPVSIRVTRGEFERAIRPHLELAVDALEEAAEAASSRGTTIDRVLLVGGSSSVPLIGQLVAARLGVSVGIDAHPQQCAALGLARIAARSAGLMSAPVRIPSVDGFEAATPMQRPPESDAPKAPLPAPPPLAAGLWPSAADAPAPPPPD